MAYDEKLAERVREVLAGRRGVTEKRLMGTLAFLVNDSMCCSVGSDGLLVRVDAEERERLLADPVVSPMQLGKRTMKGFVRVALEGVKTRARLVKWLERGMAAGKSARPRA
jgi:TfoX/Sxy family transcriptional regulator of competence genes